MFARSLTALLLSATLFSSQANIPKTNYEFKQPLVQLYYATDENGNHELDEDEEKGLKRLPNKSVIGNNVIIQVRILNKPFKIREIQGYIYYGKRQFGESMNPATIEGDFAENYIPLYDLSPGTLKENLNLQGKENYFLFISENIYGTKKTEGVSFTIDYDKKQE